MNYVFLLQKHKKKYTSKMHSRPENVSTINSPQQSRQYDQLHDKFHLHPTPSEKEIF